MGDGRFNARLLILKPAPRHNIHILPLTKGELEGVPLWTDLPKETLELGALFMGVPQPWKVAKGYVEHLLAECGVAEVSWRRLATDSFWHPGRTVQAFVKGELIATIGEVSPKIASNFKLEGPVALVDFAMTTLVKFASSSKTYQAVSPFPPAKRDLAVVVDKRTEYDDLARAIRKTDSIVSEVEWFDTYAGKNLPDGKKSVAVHITFSSPDRTLESGEVDGAMGRITLSLREQFHADIRA